MLKKKKDRKENENFFTRMHCKKCKCYLLPNIQLLDKIDCRFLNSFSFEINFFDVLIKYSNRTIK